MRRVRSLWSFSRALWKAIYEPDAFLSFYLYMSFPGRKLSFMIKISVIASHRIRQQSETKTGGKLALTLQKRAYSPLDQRRFVRHDTQGFRAKMCELC